MNKKFLIKGFAALALVVSISSCTKDVTAMSQGEIDTKSKENAELQLGLSIPNGQTWDMASQVTTNIAVNLGLDQSYTVGIYDKNPLYNKNAKYYTLKEVHEGGTLNTSLTIPSNQSMVYITVYDSKNRSVVHTAHVENGQIIANIGGGAAGSRSMRAAEDASKYPEYVETLDYYLNPINGRNRWDGWNLDPANLEEISIDGMKSYTALTDDIILNDTKDGNRTLTDENGDHFPGGNVDGRHYRVAANTEVTEVFHIIGHTTIVNNSVIYVEGTLHLNGNILYGPTIVVADGGKIILDGDTNMSRTARLIVMAGGSVEAASGVTPTFNVNSEDYSGLNVITDESILNNSNVGAPCYNAGTIAFNGEFNINGCDFYNKGTITVDKLRNTCGGFYTNFGHITARTNNDAEDDAFNSLIVNGCYLHYTEDAGVGPLTLLDHSRLDCDGQLYMCAPSRNNCIMYNYSMIDAGSIKCNQVIYTGPTEENSFAIVKTGSFYVSYANDINALNNVYFDMENIEEFYLYDADGNITKEDLTNRWGAAYHILGGCTPQGAYWCAAPITHWASEDNSSLIIPNGDCTGKGYNPGGDDGEIFGDPVVYTYAFEDQTVGTDYDMNDVVLKVSYKVKEEGTGENAGKVIYDTNTLVVKLVAAGATYNIKVKIGNTYLFNGQEIHDALHVNRGVMVNTGRSTPVAPISEEINIPAGFTGDFTQLPVSIEVLSTNTTYVYPNTDEYPHAIMVPTDWAWPTERTIITEAYPGSGTATITTESGSEFLINSFSAWAATPAAQRATVIGDIKWYETAAAPGKTMTNN